MAENLKPRKRTRQFGNIRKLPSGRYQARYQAPDGKYRNAPTTFTTKKVADGWLSKTLADIERGVWKSPEEEAAELAAAEAAAVANTTTIRDLAEQWLATIPSSNHRVLSASRVRRFINPTLGDIVVTELTREQCDDWYEQLCPDAPSQRARTFTALHTMLKLAVFEGLIPTIPLRIKGAMVETPVREPQTATAEQVDALAAAMPARFAMTVLIAAWCGLRAGEVLGLQRGDIAADWSTPAPLAPVVRITLRRHIVSGRGVGAMKIVPGTKAAKKAESVVVPPHLVPLLWSHLAEHVGPAKTDWLFPSPRVPGHPYTAVTLHGIWDHARKTVGLEHFWFHDLRRTGNTFAAESGATPGEMKQRMRHRTSSAAERYIVAAQGADVRLAMRMSQLVAPPRRQLPVKSTIESPPKSLESEVERRVQERLRELGVDMVEG